MSAASFIDLNKIKAFENKYYKNEQEHDYFKIFSHYIQSSAGTHKFFKLFIDLFAWPIRFASVIGLSSETVKKLAGVSDNFKFINKNLILAKYPGTIEGLNKSYEEYQHAKADELTRKKYKLASKVAEAVFDTSLLIQLGEVLALYSLGALNPIINLTGAFFSLFKESVSLKMDAEEYVDHELMKKVVEAQKDPAKRVVTLLGESKNLDLLNIAKSIFAITLTTFCVLDLMFKITVVAAGTLLFLSTCSTVLAIWTNFYKESFTYPSQSS